MALKVEEFDNRGTEEVPFGWVVFSDNTRVGVGGENGLTTVFPGNWGGNTDKHIELAVNFLKEKGYKFH